MFIHFNMVSKQSNNETLETLENNLEETQTNPVAVVAVTVEKLLPLIYTMGLPSPSSA